MGTRHLVTVKHEGKTKIAQYGQWDGYPTGQGETIKTFLNREDFDLDKFKSELSKVSFIDPENLDKLWREFGADENGMISMDDCARMGEKYPQFHRSTGAEILDYVFDGRVEQLEDSEEFKNDRLFCEYHYQIDVDKEEIELEGLFFSFDDWREMDMEKLEETMSDED